MRTQFCLRWSFRAFGEPLSALGLLSRELDELLQSQWKGLPLLLVLESCVEMDICLLDAAGLVAFPEMSRSTPFFCLRCAGEPFTETELTRFDCRRGGVVIVFTALPGSVREFDEETRLMLMRSAVAIWGIERRL